MADTAVYTLTPRGARLARTLALGLSGDLYLPRELASAYGARPFDRIMDVVARCFPRYKGHVFVAAAGIAVRAVAPLLGTKDQDPAVIVMDQGGRFAVSLLSGHLGGANELAEAAARITGGTPIITTATDEAGVPSWDLIALRQGMAIRDIRAVKSVNMAALRGDPLAVYDPEQRLGLEDLPGVDLVRSLEGLPPRGPAVMVTWQEPAGDSPGTRLVLHPRSLVAGVGCNRGTPAAEILDLITTTFAGRRLALKALKCIATIEDKQGETGIREAAERLGAGLEFHPAGRVREVDVPNPSEVVGRHMGVKSVCEATAILSSKGGTLLVPKTRSRNATLAVALEGSS